jgi:hypothetical protein
MGFEGSKSEINMVFKGSKSKRYYPCKYRGTFKECMFKNFKIVKEVWDALKT